MSGTIATLPKFQFSSNTGTPLALGTLTVYVAGSTTPTNTWQDSALTTLNTNPITLDSRGECVLWLDSAVNYKFILKNAGGVIQWTQDNISGAASFVDIAASSGASLVGYMPAGTGAVATTVQAKLRESVSVGDFLPEGFNYVNDAQPYIQAAVDAVYAAGGGTIYFDAETYVVSSQVDCYKGSARRIRLIGQGRSATVINTALDTTVFYHAENFDCSDMFIAQTGTAKTGRAFSTPTNKQAAYCRYERIGVSGFKFGVWWRYSLWNSVRDVTFTNCGAGVKMSRNAFPDDQTNPAAPGIWNIDPGFFHNQNTFDNVLCNGGEVGIWGSCSGNVFNNLTCQGQSDSSGASNTVLPVSTQGIGLYLQNGSGTTLTGAHANSLTAYYSEYTRQPIVLEYVGLSVGSLFFQGGASSGAAYPQGWKITGGTVDARGCVTRGQDWFTYQIVATDANIYGDPGAGTTLIANTLSGAHSLSNTNWWRHGSQAVVNYVYSPAGVSTTTVATAVNRNTYRVEVGGLYNGATSKVASFLVNFWASGTASVLTVTGSAADITCTVSGASIQINTTNASPYDLYVTVTQNRMTGQFPYGS